MDLSAMRDSAASEPLTAANLDHSEDCRTDHPVSPRLVVKG